jgi:L-fucose isomerase-like protein
VLIGVPDYVPGEVTDGPITVDPTSFGAFSEGLLNVSKVKTGPATLARLTYSGGKYYMHILPGEAITPRSWEEAGWTPPAPQLPSLEFKFNDVTVDEFADKVIAQHYIIAYGDQTEVLKDYCKIAGIEMW